MISFKQHRNEQVGNKKPIYITTNERQINILNAPLKDDKGFYLLNARVSSEYWVNILFKIGRIFMVNTLFPATLEAGAKLIDRLVPDVDQREQAKLTLLQADGQQALQEMQASLSRILVESNSVDPWTSRARPTFLYIIYSVILLSVLGSIIGVWWPKETFQAAENLSSLLNAIPEGLWWLFGASYLGYTGARSFDKARSHDQ